MPKDDFYELEESISPDPDALDREWVKQPRLRMHYGRMLADAKMDLAKSKDALEVVEAELDQSMRMSPKKFGLEKITEGAIKAAILTQSEYQEASQELISNQHAVDIMTAAVAAVDHKKAALEDLVRLRLADYYSECRAPEGAREEMEEMTKASVRQRGSR